MTKIIRIENCQECVYKQRIPSNPAIGFVGYLYCGNDKGCRICPKEGTPSWCPLPDKERRYEPLTPKDFIPSLDKEQKDGQS